MPKDTVERAIKRGAGGEGGETYDEVRYEGYGPGGVAVIVEALTDNRNRTASEVRAAFTKVGRQPRRDQQRQLPVRPRRRDRLSGRGGRAPTRCSRPRSRPAPTMSRATPSEHVVTCAPEDLNAVRDALEQRFGPADSARLVWRPKTTAPVDEETADALVQAARDARGQRRRAERLRQFRGGRRRAWRGSAPDRAATPAPTPMRLSGSIPGCGTPAGASSTSRGNRLTHVADGVVACRAASGRWPSGWSTLFRQLDEVLERFAPGRGGGRGELRQQEPGLDLEARRRPRRRAAGAGRARPAGRRIFGQPGQEIGGRRRPCRQGAGADDGAPAAAGLRDRRAPTPPMRSPSRSATRITPQHGACGSLGAERGAMIAKLAGIVDQVGAGRRRHRCRRRRLSRLLLDAHARPAAGARRAGAAADRDPCPRGPHPPLRLYRRGRARLVPPADDGAGRRRAARARDPVGARARRARRRDRWRRTRRR